MKQIAEKNSMCLIPVMQPELKGNLRLRLALHTVTLIFLICGLAGMIHQTFEGISNGDIAVAGVVGIIGGFSLLWLLPKEGRVSFFALTVPVILLLFYVIFYQTIKSSGIGLVNQVRELMQMRQGTIWLPVEGEGNIAIFAILVALMISAVLISLVILYLTKLSLLFLASSWVLAGFGWLSADLWFLVFNFGCLLLLLETARVKNTDTAEQPLMQSAVQMLVGVLIVTAVILITGVGSNINTEQTASDIRNSVHELRYEEGKQVLPEGQFSGDFHLNYSGTEMMKVEMDRPESLYLQGHIYSEYGEDGWTRLPDETASDASELFYWLHQEGFYSESQLALLRETLSMEGDEHINVSVQVKAACRENLYLPPELSTESITLNQFSLGDGDVHSKRFFGEKTYEFQTEANLVSKAYEMLETLDKNRNLPEVKEYLRLEESYRDFVYENYLSIPKECAELIKTYMPEAQERMTTNEAKHTIRSVLGKEFTYSETADLLSGGAQLLSGFKEDGGNCIHHATTAVLMLRACGIPARYVEGYIITPEEAAASGGTLTLTGKNAHAWAEYYEDGVGWIPFETAPNFIGLMEESLWRWYHIGESEINNGDVPMDIPNEGKDSSTSPQTEINDTSDTYDQWENRSEQNPRAEMQGEILKWLLIIFMLLMLTGIVLLVLRRKKVLAKRQERFESSQISTALSALFAYSMELMKQSGLDSKNCLLKKRKADIADWFGEEEEQKENAEEFSDMQLLNEEAIFSDHEFSEDDRLRMKKYAEKTLERFKDKSNILQRLYRKWICCMY